MLAQPNARLMQLKATSHTIFRYGSREALITVQKRKRHLPVTMLLIPKCEIADNALSQICRLPAFVFTHNAAQGFITPMDRPYLPTFANCNYLLLRTIQQKRLIVSQYVSQICQLPAFVFTHNAAQGFNSNG
jgi:hypothetical protein